MKEILLCAAAACVFAAGCNRAAHPVSPAAPTGQATAGKVFFSGKGPDREVERFKKFFAIALDDCGLASVETPGAADAVVNVEFKEEETTHYLYAPVVRVVLTSRQGEKYLVQSCRTVSTSANVFKEPVTVINFPVNWRKEHQAVSAIYISEGGVKDSEGLAQILKKSLPEQGYRVAENRAGADAELESIGIQKVAMPMRTIDRGLHYEVLDKDSNRFAYNTGIGTSAIRYLGPEKPIDEGSLPCAFANFGETSPEAYPWTDAISIARTIQGHLKHK